MVITIIIIILGIVGNIFCTIKGMGPLPWIVSGFLAFMSFKHPDFWLKAFLTEMTVSFIVGIITFLS